jgi:hypothetical protein
MVCAFGIIEMEGHPMHRFDPGNLVLTPDGAGTVQFFCEEDKTYGVQLDTKVEFIYIYPAQTVCSLDGKMQALRDMLSKICVEATIWDGYLPSSTASIIEEANKLLLQETSSFEEVL